MGIFDTGGGPQPGPNPTQNIFGQMTTSSGNSGLDYYLKTGDWAGKVMGLPNPYAYLGDPNQYKQQDQQQQQPNYQQQLFEMLNAGLNSGAPSTLTPQQVRAAAQQQAGLQFDPQIAAINAEMARAKTQTGQNTKQLSDLYGQLANSYGPDVKTAKANNAAAKQAEASALKQLQSQVGGQYQDSQNQQKTELTKLGLQDILPSTTANQKADLQFLGNLNNTESAAQQRALDLQGQADQSFYQQGRGIAQTEGAQNISDLTNALGQYLNQEGTQLSSLQANKAAAVNSFMNQMQNSQNDAVSKFQQSRWDNALKLLQAYDTMTKGQTNQQTPKGWLGALNILQNSQGTSGYQGLSDQFHNLLDQPDFRQGQFQGANGTMYKMTPEQAANEARSWAQQQGLSSADTLALVNSVVARYGGL